MREERVHPSQTSSVAGRSRVSSCSRSSKASSVLSERVKLAAEKAAMVAEVSLLQESGSLTQERLHLEHQERLLKLRTEIAKTEAKEKVYEEFNAVEEEIPDHPRKFTPLPHVEPHEVFERGSKPLKRLRTKYFTRLNMRKRCKLSRMIGYFFFNGVKFLIHLFFNFLRQ